MSSTVYFSVNRNATQNWSSSRALRKLSSPTNSAGTSSASSVSEIWNVRTNGYTVKARTKRRAGAT